MEKVQKKQDIIHGSVCCPVSEALSSLGLELNMIIQSCEDIKRTLYKKEFSIDWARNELRNFRDIREKISILQETIE